MSHQVSEKEPSNAGKCVEPPVQRVDDDEDGFAAVGGKAAAAGEEEKEEGSWLLESIKPEEPSGDTFGEPAWESSERLLPSQARYAKMLLTRGFACVPSQS